MSGHRVGGPVAGGKTQLFQGDDAEAVFFADSFDGGLFLGAGALGDFGGGRVGKTHRHGPPGMPRAGGLEEQGSLHEALTQDQIDLEGGTQGVAGIGDAGGLLARFAHQRVVGAGINPGESSKPGWPGLGQTAR